MHKGHTPPATRTGSLLQLESSHTNQHTRTHSSHQAFGFQSAVVSSQQQQHLSNGEALPRLSCRSFTSWGEHLAVSGWCSISSRPAARAGEVGCVRGKEGREREREHIQGEGTAIKRREGQNYEMRDSEKMCVWMGDGVTMERATPKLL